MSAGLYLHVPFCSAICPYCDFAVQKGDTAQARRFVDAVILEIETLVARAPAELSAPIAELVDTSFDTIYLGGGTPSLLALTDLENLLAYLRSAFSFSAATRLFFEANPEDVNSETVAAWRRLGVETLSLGIQSFNDSELNFLGRRHDANAARAAFRCAREAGFATISIDLIYGLPGQKLEDWQRGLEAALALDPDHLSCYELEIHEQTSFGKAAARGRLRPLPEDDQAELFLFTHHFLEDHGYEGYEVSNFARAPEHRSRHNAKYWDHTPYLGLGPSAHSYGGARRFWNERQAASYERRLKKGASAIAAWETLEPRDLVLERLMLGLRTKAGIDLCALEESYRVELIAPNRALLASWRDRGWIEPVDQLVPTLEGRARADRLATELAINRK